jgi:serine protease Do
MQKVKGSIRWAVLAAFVLGAVLGGPLLVREVAYAITSGEQKALREGLAELSKHDQMSGLFAAVAKAVQPAVVVVKVSQKVQTGAGSAQDMDDLLRRFFGDDAPRGMTPRMPGPRGRGMPMPQSPRENIIRGLGSGVIVDAEKGYIITNAHVVDGAATVDVTLADGRSEKAEWVRVDPQTDLAVIKIQADNLIAAPLANSDEIEVGHWVLAIGAPRGLSKTVTAGIISAKGRSSGNGGSYESYLQTDAAINQGNSGGPLVSMKGEVLGINSAIMTHTGGNEGIGFAIPSNMVRDVMHQLIEKGSVTRGFLGVTIQNVDEDLAKDLRLPSHEGALVSSVSPGSPAEKAGIKDEDFLVSVNGKAVANVNELRNTVAALEPGKTVTVELYRDGKKQKVEVKLDAQPKDLAAMGGPAENPPSAKIAKFGLKVAAPTKDLAEKYSYKEPPKGVIVTEIDPASVAAERGLQEGQTILQAGGKDIASVEDFEKVLSAKEHASGVRLLVTDPSGGKRVVFVKPEK